MSSASILKIVLEKRHEDDYKNGFKGTRFYPFDGKAVNYSKYKDNIINTASIVTACNEAPNAALQILSIKVFHQIVGGNVIKKVGNT